jgi:archaellum component FlaF (FlaF/FlaG flagellin family)
MLIKSRFILVLLCFCTLQVLGDFKYKPEIGDKFDYKLVGSGNKKSTAILVFDKLSHLITFHYSFGNDKLTFGSWVESKNKTPKLLIDLNDSSQADGDLTFLNATSFESLKTGKKFNLLIENEVIEFSKKELTDYLLPIKGISLPFKMFTAISKDKKWSISVLNNDDYPMIIEISGKINWKLNTITPCPSYPITQSLVGQIIDSAKAKLFNTYTSGTCHTLEAKFTENFSKVNFKEFFCPIIGLRYSLKNDTITSIRLLSNTYHSEGYTWHNYRGVFYSIFKIGDSKKEIEKYLGKPFSNSNEKNYYPNHGFSLIYNANNILIEVEYQ